MSRTLSLVVLAACALPTGEPADTDAPPTGDVLECYNGGRIALTDPTAPLPPFAGAPADLIAPLVGAFTAELTPTDPTDPPTTLTVDLVAGTIFHEPSLEGEGLTEAQCRDELLVELTVTLSADPYLAETLPGWLQLTTDGSARLVLEADLAALNGTIAPSWDPAGDTGRVVLESFWDGAAWAPGTLTVYGGDGLDTGAFGEEVWGMWSNASAPE